jgi:CMP-N,N'-diacetyllegionaminic acid synthase
MIGNKKILAVIPARGGSKTLPKKNIKILDGKPLIGWTIEQALGSNYLDKIVVSTDCEEIASVARELGAEVPFLRPAEIAQDTTSHIGPITHALGKLPGYDLVIMLQPTSPLRLSSDIDSALEKFISDECKTLVSVTEADQPPFWMYTVNNNSKTMSPLIKGEFYKRRQDMPVVYVLNGSIYIADVPWFLEKQTFLDEYTSPYIMPKVRSFDIDDNFDFYLAEMVKNGKLPTT